MAQNVNQEIVAAARSKIGAPFYHHFKPVNNCRSGLITVDSCMEQGLDERGYDCVGLVIASLCQVLKISTSNWPRHYRHIKQLTPLTLEAPAEPGDALILDPDRTSQIRFGAHMGILATKNSVVHASGITKHVEEGEILGNFEQMLTLPATVLLDIAEQT